MQGRFLLETICSCNDGLRPVIFKLEATEEESVIDYTPVRVRSEFTPKGSISGCVNLGGWVYRSLTGRALRRDTDPPQGPSQMGIGLVGGGGGELFQVSLEHSS